ncbi:MAG: serine O-acetyltransferase EpsC [Kosmotogaceae bacterium]
MNDLTLLTEFKKLLNNINIDIEQYQIKDPSAGSSAYIIFTSTGFQALVFYRISKFFWDLRMKWISFLIHYFSKILFSVDIHPGANLEAGVVIDHGIGTVIGETASVGSGTLIYHKVTLGNRVVINGKRHPDIGRNVTIGAGAKILGPIYIGDNAKIGANSVVLHHVCKNDTVVGIPAKSIQKKKEINYEYNKDYWQHTYSKDKKD